MTEPRWSPERVTATAILAVYAIWVLGIAIRAGNPTELWWWLLEIPFFLWIVAPLALPLLFFRSWFWTVTAALIAGYSIYIYERDMFDPGARSTSALIFIFLPIYQWAVVLALILVGGLIVWSSSRAGEK